MPQLNIILIGMVIHSLVAIPLAVAQEPMRTCKRGLDETQLQCRVISTPEAPVIGPRRDVRKAAPAPPAADILYRPQVVRRADGNFCVVFRREVFPGAANSRRASESEFLMLRLIRTYPLCAGQSRPPATPSTLAREVIEQIDLPAPSIEIDPGFAITGMKAYLETNGTLHPDTYVRPTRLGDISVDADAEYVVDWGDGTPVERYGYEGRAWPDGGITHVYTDLGHYDVVVTAEWVAHWSIGERRGAVRDLRTSDRIETSRLARCRRFATAELCDGRLSRP